MIGWLLHVAMPLSRCVAEPCALIRRKTTIGLEHPEVQEFTDGVSVVVVGAPCEAGQ